MMEPLFTCKSFLCYLHLNATQLFHGVVAEFYSGGFFEGFFEVVVDLDVHSRLIYRLCVIGNMKEKNLLAQAEEEDYEEEPKVSKKKKHLVKGIKKVSLESPSSNFL